MSHTQPTPLPGPGRWIPPEELQALRRSPLEAMLRATRRYGDLFEYPVGFWKVVVVNDPTAIRHILQDNGRNWSKDTFQYNLLGNIAGNGLLTNHGPSWLPHRRLMQPAFHRERLAALGAGMVAAVERLAAQWEPLADTGATLDVDAAMMALTLEIVGAALFSADLRVGADALTGAVLATLDHIVFRAQTPIAPPAWVPTGRNRRFRAALRQLDAAVYALIAARRQDGGTRGDLLDTLLAARDEETGEGLSNAEVRDELLTLIIAGHETVASALSWTWYLLSLHPTATRALHAELDTVLAGRLPTVADLPRLPTTRRVVDETLRLYPPAWLMTRRAVEVDTLGGLLVPAGTLAVLSPYVTHRHPALWPNPEGFDPDRFLPEAAALRPKFAYFPFGGGPHLCIGNHFALMEMTLLLATLASRFRLDLLPGHPVQVEPLVTLRPKHGLPMTLHAR